MNNDLISREALLKEVRENKELFETERVYLEGLLLNAPAVDLVSPTINVNIPEETKQKLIEELQKPQKLLVLPESEITFERLQGDLISREALRKAFHERIYYFNKSSWDEANAIINNAPTLESPYKAIAIKQDELLKESIAVCDKLKAENVKLKNKMELACSMLQELSTKIENQCNIDFPNSKKGGQGETGTPSIFPEDSNKF